MTYEKQMIELLTEIRDDIRELKNSALAMNANSVQNAQKSMEVVSGLMGMLRNLGAPVQGGK